MKSVKRANERQSMCLLFHNFINRLSVIVGNCDLAKEEAQRAGTTDLPHMRRIPVVRCVAMEMVRELREHMCELDAATRTTLVGDTVKGMEMSEFRRGITSTSMDRVDKVEKG